MPDFPELFIKTKGQAIEYKGKTLHMGDDFPINNGDKLIIKIEKTNSEWRQGLTIDITGQCEYDGQYYKHGKGIRMLFWEDTAPKKIELTVFTKKESILIYNIWDTGNGSVDYWHNGAAMIIEEIEDGRRYRCNDAHPDENFDDIIFTVQKDK